jgi:hypothetical protein
MTEVGARFLVIGFRVGLHVEAVLIGIQVWWLVPTSESGPEGHFWFILSLFRALFPVQEQPNHMELDLGPIACLRTYLELIAPRSI